MHTKERNDRFPNERKTNLNWRQKRGPNEKHVETEFSEEVGVPNESNNRFEPNGRKRTEGCPNEVK